jgi:exodeoxyribonuclease VII large subunit
MNVWQCGVAEFARAIKGCLEEKFNYIAIKGEISGFKPHSSGHAYFKLKEEEHIINAVCFKSQFNKINLAIDNGMQVCVYGKVTAYTSQSQYQIIAEKIELDGIGAMLAFIEKIKQKLEQEGLFDNKHKKPIPFFPNSIGIITSPTGAVIEDIKHRIEDRCPTKILLYSALVQGNKASAEIIAGIRYFNNLSENRPDVIIIARGGGSLEDLMPFNDEALARAVFASNIPIISAIGHETDYTIIDFVADKRAPTPTAAAEFAVPVLLELKRKLEYLSRQSRQTWQNYIQNNQQKLQFIYKSLPNLEQYMLKLTENIQKTIERYRFVSKNLLINKQNIIKTIKIPNLAVVLERKQLLLIDYQSKITNILQQNWQTKQIKFSKIYINKTASILHINQKKELINNYRNKITQQISINIANKINSLNHNYQMLTSYHYDNVLQRGFAIVYNENNQVVTDCSMLSNNLTIQLRDGKVKVKKEIIG